MPRIRKTTSVTVELSKEVSETLNQLTEDGLFTKKALVKRLIEWFAMQDMTTRMMVLGLIDKEQVEDIRRLIVEKMTANPHDFDSGD